MTDHQIYIEYIGGNCPVQSEGKIGEKPFYFRARWDKWSMSIGGDDVILNPEWYYEEHYGSSPGEAGWMPQYEALRFISMCIKRYCETANSDQTQDL